MRRFALLTVLVAALLAGRDCLAWEGAPEDAERPTGRVFLENGQGLVLLSGGHVDRYRFYADLWDPGPSFSLGAGYQVLPVLRCGLRAALSGHGDIDVGIDHLYQGHVSLTASLELPFALESSRWLSERATRSVLGLVGSLTLEGGVQVIDPLWDAFGRILERTFTWTLAGLAGLEYRFSSLGVFLCGGVAVAGPPRPAAGYAYDPQVFLHFPLYLGVRVYL